MNIVEYLDTHEKLVYTNKGCSMMPLIKQGRDMVIIRKKGEERLKKYDVALYVKGSNHYILHRVIKVNKDDYTIRGDNNYFTEYGIKDSDIVGVLIGFIRKGREHSVDEFGYKVYSRVWRYIYPLRYVWRRRPSFMKRIKFMKNA